MKTELHLQGDDLVVHYQQDVEPILEFCKAQHNAGFHGTSEMRHAALVPDILVYAYIERNGITFHEFIANDEHMKRFLDDPSLSQFRIWKGKL